MHNHRLERGARSSPVMASSRTLRWSRSPPSLPAMLVAMGLLAGVAGCSSSSPRSAIQAPPAPAAAADPIPDWATTSLTVGELLAKGGRQLNGAQVKIAMTGAVMEGAAGNTFWREMSFPDGKVTGQTKMADGLVIDYEGTWWVDEQGRRCWMNQQQRSQAPACTYLYLLGDRYYAAEVDSTRKNARLEPRRIRK